jgi:tripartite-type tricarboxylate transporter receptor subunit TctC
MTQPAVLVEALTHATQLLLVAIAWCVAGAASASAAYPERPIRLIVPYAPGGAVDAVGRLMAQELAQRVGQQVVVDNRGGAGGVIGIEIAAHAPPDGYTLLVGSVGVASLPGLHKKLPFDPVKDFAPISISMTGTYLLGVNASLPVSSVKGTDRRSQAEPRRVQFRFVWHRIDYPSRGRALQEHGGLVYRSRALQKRGPRNDRSDCRAIFR